jgi:hypothetical protein
MIDECPAAEVYEELALCCISKAAARSALMTAAAAAAAACRSTDCNTC